MPTTCGFPNCKFRSRYRGQEDNRHFYRIPKRPTQLRQRWLNAIGRTEETVVSQLRICSAHFSDGEKKDGDIPVPDPMLDPPVFISLPPKELRGSNASSSIQRLAAKRSKLLMQHHHNRLPPAYRKRHSIRINRQSGVNNEQRNYFGDSLVDTEPSGVESIFQKSALQQHQDLADSAVNFPVSTSCSPGVPFFSTELPGGGFLTQQTPRIYGLFLTYLTVSVCGFLFFSIFYMICSVQAKHNQPFWTATFGGPFGWQDCSIEMPLLKDVATVAFCDAQSTTEIHEKVLNEAVAALLYHSISLSKEDLMKFKALKVVVRIGSGVHNVDLAAASELGIAICNTPAECVEETADSTISLILNMYRKTYWIAKAVQSGRQTNNVEQLENWQSGHCCGYQSQGFWLQSHLLRSHLPNGIDRALGIERCETLVEALSRSDCISLHCPLLPDTRYMLNQESMQKMKFGAFLINTSAAELVMNSALLSALKTGQVKAAALDIYEKECVDDISSEIFAQMHNVICTPHCAWFSDESSKELRVSAAKEIRRAWNRSDSKPTIHPAAKQQHLNGVQQHNKPAFAPHLGATNTAPPPGIGLSASDPFAAFAAAGMPTDALTAFGSSSTKATSIL
uniref:THAP-type domain-containing protein n=1 Tax=Ditylenchus dipsaci TaxID=166011 RepID=A0A915E3Q4_9BILA